MAGSLILSILGTVWLVAAKVDYYNANPHAHNVYAIILSVAMFWLAGCSYIGHAIESLRRNSNVQSNEKAADISSV